MGVKKNKNLFPVYIDLGNTPTDQATLAFSFNGVNNARIWEIKISQIECTNPNRWPIRSKVGWRDTFERFTCCRGFESWPSSVRGKSQLVSNLWPLRPELISITNWPLNPISTGHQMVAPNTGLPWQAGSALSTSSRPTSIYRDIWPIKSKLRIKPRCIIALSFHQLVVGNAGPG